MEGKSIHFNEVVIVELQWRGKNAYETNNVLHLKFPTSCMDIKGYMESEIDLTYMATRVYGKGMRNEEKIATFKKNYRILRMKIGAYMGKHIVEYPKLEDYE